MTAIRPARQILGMLLLMASLFLVTSVTAFASDHQTSSNTRDINQETCEVQGETSGDGNAVAGKPTAKDRAVVVQRNIQHDGNNENVTQDASNDATVDQYTCAETGDAHAEEGGTAKSGDATAMSSAVVVQMNVQIVAGRCEDDEVHQEAHNKAYVEQDTEATSGEANADEDATATSGDATAKSKASVRQYNKQIHVCGVEHLERDN